MQSAAAAGRGVGGFGRLRNADRARRAHAPRLTPAGVCHRCKYATVSLEIGSSRAPREYAQSAYACGGAAHRQEFHMSESNQWVIDASHSNAGFTVKHMMIT